MKNEGDIGQQSVDAVRLGMKEIRFKGLIPRTFGLLPSSVRDNLHVLSRTSEKFVKNFSLSSAQQSTKGSKIKVTRLSFIKL